ncbi:hypothetical protein MYOV011v1_p0311 [Vibrio phage 6E35.1a]|nr:hypothetical protein MYOV011v1_p0311 [Vibrio phage 6E35.1a]
MNRIASFNRVDSSYDYITDNGLANVPTVLQALYNMMIATDRDVEYGVSTDRTDVLYLGICFVEYSYNTDREHFNDVIRMIGSSNRIVIVYNSWQVKGALKWIRDNVNLSSSLERVLSADIALAPLYENNDVELIEQTFGHRVLTYNPSMHIDCKDYGTFTRNKKRQVVYGELDMNLASTFTQRFNIPESEFLMFNFKNVIHEKLLVEKYYSESWFVLMPSHLGDTCGMGFWRSKVQHAINVGSIIITDEHEYCNLGEAFRYTYDDVRCMSDDELLAVAHEQCIAFEMNLSETRTLANFDQQLRSISL